MAKKESKNKWQKLLSWVAKTCAILATEYYLKKYEIDKEMMKRKD